MAGSIAGDNVTPSRTLGKSKAVRPTQRLHELENALKSKDEEVKQLKRSIEQMSDELRQAKELSQEKQTDAFVAQEEARTAQIKLQALKDKDEERYREMIHVKQRALTIEQKAKKERDLLAAEIQDTLLLLSSTEEQLEALRGTKEEKENELWMRISELNNAKNVAEDAFEEAERRQAEADATITAIRSEMAEIEKERDSLHSSLEETKRKLSELEKDLGNVRAEDAQLRLASEARICELAETVHRLAEENTAALAERESYYMRWSEELRERMMKEREEHAKKAVEDARKAYDEEVQRISEASEKAISELRAELEETRCELVDVGVQLMCNNVAAFHNQEWWEKRDTMGEHYLTGVLADNHRLKAELSSTKAALQQTTLELQEETNRAERLECENTLERMCGSVVQDNLAASAADRIKEMTEDLVQVRLELDLSLTRGEELSGHCEGLAKEKCDLLAKNDALSRQIRVVQDSLEMWQVKHKKERESRLNALAEQIAATEELRRASSIFAGQAENREEHIRQLYAELTTLTRKLRSAERENNELRQSNPEIALYIKNTRTLCEELSERIRLSETLADRVKELEAALPEELRTLSKLEPSIPGARNLIEDVLASTQEFQKVVSTGQVRILNDANASNSGQKLPTPHNDGNENAIVDEDCRASLARGDEDDTSELSTKLAVAAANVEVDLTKGADQVLTNNSTVPPEIREVDCSTRETNLSPEVNTCSVPEPARHDGDTKADKGIQDIESGGTASTGDVSHISHIPDMDANVVRENNASDAGNVATESENVPLQAKGALKDGGEENSDPPSAVEGQGEGQAATNENT
eukprot:Rmarinus@m.10311